MSVTSRESKNSPKFKAMISVVSTRSIHVKVLYDIAACMLKVSLKDNLFALKQSMKGFKTENCSRN